MTEDIEEVRERVRRANAHLEAVWPRRMPEPDEAQNAVDELIDAAKALADALKREGPGSN